ncbi:hypothetical protein AgCh_018216 [Apium graveolens]
MDGDGDGLSKNQTPIQVEPQAEPMCKKILNFPQIGSHKGVAIGKMLLDLFAQWGIDRIFTITLDNASSNDKAISYLKKFLRGPETILENKFLYMRCCAHILNLVVKDGLKEQHDSIARVQNATRYVRSSPARLEKFKKCVEREKIKCEKMVCLDVDTKCKSWQDDFEKYMDDQDEGGIGKSELDVYLVDPRERK